MQIVTDRGCDITSEQCSGVEIHFAPMHLTLDGKTYSSGVDITPEQFYDLFDRSQGYPTTSQATPGDFAEIYRRLAKNDPEILSIHISSGLSGTLASAKAAAEMVPEAHVTFWDTLTLSAPEGWQVEAAARALKAGWPLDKILNLLEKVRTATEGRYTLDTLKYLIHGGRISHLKGLLASMLHIRPVIGVEREHGRYFTLAQERTMGRALQKLADTLLKYVPEGGKLRVQLVHAKNFAAIEHLTAILNGMFECRWLPTLRVAPILGAHTGSSAIGLAAGPAEVYDF